MSTEKPSSFRLLLTGQYLAAFGDNAILAVILGQLLFAQQAGQLSEEGMRTAGAIYTALLFVPYVLLAPLAGYLNDRFRKTHCLAAGNALRVLGATVCCLGGGGPWSMGAGYFLVGVGSCIYGPGKYGILPEIVARDRLVRANGLVELWTLVAILTGGVGGAWLTDKLAGNPAASFGVMAGVFGAAWVCAAFMPRTPDDPSVVLRRSVNEFFSYAGTLARHRRLGLILLGSALFWWCGAAMKMNFQPWGLEALKLESNLEVSLLGVWLSVGVMIGSILAGVLHQVGDLRRTRLYAFGLALTLLVLAFVRLDSGWWAERHMIGAIPIIPHAVAVLVATGLMAGLFLIPLNAALQAESDPSRLGKTIAVQNLADNGAMCIAFGAVFGAVKLGLSPGGVFLVLAGGIVLALLALRRLGQAR